MSATVIRWEPERDGPVREDGLRRRLEAMGYRVRRYVYPPGTYFSPHVHEMDKADAVVSGRFELVLEGERLELGPGDIALVPSGALHSARVLGDGPVVSLDGVKI